MNASGAGTALLLGLALGGCTIVRPLYDTQMADAPHAACAAVNGSHPLVMRAAAAAPTATAEAEAPRQCFVLLEESPDGRRADWSGGALQPGRTLVAIHQPGAAGCTGRFSHLTVTGGSSGAGQAELATWDPIGRPGHGRIVRWERGFGERTFALASIDNVTMAPAGARIRVTQGSLDPANLCFKSY